MSCLLDCLTTHAIPRFLQFYLLSEERRYMYRKCSLQYWNLSDNRVTCNIGILLYMLKFIIIILCNDCIPCYTLYPKFIWECVISQICIPCYKLKFVRLSCFSTIGIYPFIYWSLSDNHVMCNSSIQRYILNWVKHI